MNIAFQNTPRFSLGQVVATPGSLRALEASNQQPFEFLARHIKPATGVKLMKKTELKTNYPSKRDLES